MKIFLALLLGLVVSLPGRFISLHYGVSTLADAGMYLSYMSSGIAIAYAVSVGRKDDAR